MVNKISELYRNITLRVNGNFVFTLSLTADLEETKTTFRKVKEINK